MNLEQPVKVGCVRRKKTAKAIAEKIMLENEPRLLKKYIRSLGLSGEDSRRVRMLAEALLEARSDDASLVRYRRERLALIASPVEDCLRKRGIVIPMGVLNFLCAGYKRELRSVCSVAAELIAEEKHGDLCCLIANEYIEKRRRVFGSKLIAVHLVIDGDDARLYDGNRRDITDKYSTYLPSEDRARYSPADLCLSAMVDIAPRSIYVYGSDSNLRLLRRIQLMFGNVFPVEGKLELREPFTLSSAKA